MGKAVLIFVLGSVILFTIINVNMNTRIGAASQDAIDRFSETSARNIANSVAEMLLYKIADSTSYRTASLQSMDNIFSDAGSATYRVIDTTIGAQDLIKIEVKSTYNEIPSSATVYASTTSDGFIPATVKAAISTNNPVSTLGTLVVDGRDHDLNGNLLGGGTGTLGIWSTQTIDQSGNSEIGGTVAGVDEAPEKPAEAGTTGANQAYPGGYPPTPDSLLGGTPKGFPEGTLKSIAQSGMGGSQYTTNPNTLNHPFKGVTYVELPSGTPWISSNIDGTGILIIHNSSTNAIIKNENLGTFKGLIIADDIIHIHTTIIGAIIGLSPTPSEGNTIGNGSGDVLFSRKAITDAIGSVLSASNYGFAKHRMRVVSWYE
ncbi:MAG: hypothetical protein WC061_00865 [Melioribacteraceae bacterium]